MVSKITTSYEAVAQILDNATVTVSSSSGLGCPDKVLLALGKRFDTEGHPKNLTMLLPIAAGDMYGIKGIDHIAKEGLISRIFAGSYPSGPSSKQMPKIWKMIVEDRIEAYNIPSGIMFDMHRDVAARKPGVFTKVGINTFVDPIREGCAMNDSASKNPIVHRQEFEGETWLHFPNIVPNVAIVRGTTSDENGNITFEHEGAYLGALELAIAVRNHGGLVIAQVKRVTANGSFRPQNVHIPCNLVDMVVIDPDQKQTTDTFYDPAISGDVLQPWSSFDLVDHGIEKIIARRACLELSEGQSAVLGFGISANVPRILLEEGYQQSITWAIEQGAVGGVPLKGFAFGCSANAHSIVPSPNQFMYFQGGGFDIAFLSFLEVDREGNVNVSKLDKKPYLTAGCGGFVDITSHAKKIVFSGYFEAGAKFNLKDDELIITTPGKFTKMVDKVEHVTFSGQRAREMRQEVIYITERCVIKLKDNGLVATEIMPGIDPKRDIVDVSEGRVQISDNATMISNSILSSKLMGLKL